MFAGNVQDQLRPVPGRGFGPLPDLRASLSDVHAPNLKIQWRARCESLWFAFCASCLLLMVRVCVDFRFYYNALAGLGYAQVVVLTLLEDFIFCSVMFAGAWILARYFANRRIIYHGPGPMVLLDLRPEDSQNAPLKYDSHLIEVRYERVFLGFIYWREKFSDLCGTIVTFALG